MSKSLNLGRWFAIQIFLILAQFAFVALLSVTYPDATKLVLHGKLRGFCNDYPNIFAALLIGLGWLELLRWKFAHMPCEAGNVDA